jgi:hypothetical protein
LSTQRNHTPGGETSWKCGDTGAGDYSNLLDAALMTLSFPLGVESQLTYWQYVAAETSAAYPGQAYDGGRLEINVGGDWELLTPEGGYPFTVRGTDGPFPQGAGIFSGHRDWHQVVVDLSAYEGSAQLRFRFGSDTGVTDEGWYVDDVFVDGFQLDPQDVAGPPPARSLLAAHWPNPIRSRATIEFALREVGPARLAIYSAEGRLVRMLVDRPLTSGRHVIEWDRTDQAGRRVAPGVYFYKLATPAQTATRQMIVVR